MSTVLEPPPSPAPPAAPSRGVPGELELSVVMPCLNEERTVGTCVAKAVRTMQQLGVRGEVVVVDNGSSDNSVSIAEQAGARVIRHDLRGYGNALRKGFAEARGRFVIMGDCDDSYDFTDLERFLVRLRGGADVVMGNRLKGEHKPGAMPWLHRYVGNPGLTWFLNLLFKTGVGDTHCGMRGFKKEALDRLNLHMPGMEFASELVIKCALAKYRIEEIPITLWPDGRDRPPHLRSFRDGWRHLRFMLLCSPGFLFILPGLILTLLGLAAIPGAILAGGGQYTGFWGPTFQITASMVALTGFHLLAFGVVAKLYAQQADPIFHDRRASWLARVFTVDRGALLGLALVVIALAIAVPVFVHWWQTTAVPMPGLWILAGTLFLVGVETIFTAFLIGLLELQKEATKTG